ncbi:MAG: hypothetical protein RLZZ440_988 [Planctomycetota bacterium]
MQNLLAKLAALGILVGGFALTGDLGWLAERGQRVLGTAEVASAPALAFAETAQPTQSDRPPAEAVPPLSPGPPADSSAQAQLDEGLPPLAEPAVPPIDPSSAAGAPSPAASLPVAEFKPPAGGPEAVVLADLRAGDRVVVWLGSTRHRCLVFDLVDPSAGGALVYEAAAVTREGRPLAAAGPPRRVVISGQTAVGSGTDRIVRGGAVHLVEAGVAAGQAGGEWLGPVESLAVID